MIGPIVLLATLLFCAAVSVVAGAAALALFATGHVVIGAVAMVVSVLAGLISFAVYVDYQAAR